jgi:titin
MTSANRVRFLPAREQVGAFAVAAFLAVLTVPHGSAATLVVSNTSASGPGSLQQAFLDANATNGLDTIIFKIPGAGVHTITPTNALPPITNSVVIDATTQPGFAGTPLIELDGSTAGNNDGLRLFAGSSTIRGLAINRFAASAIHVQFPSGTNFIQGNFIGTSPPSGSTARGNGSEGIWLNTSTGNLIGGTGTNGNVIAANGDAGVYLSTSASNTIQGNFIGLNAAGTAALGNTNNGIYLADSPGNLVGGTTPGARNVVSGNSGSGLYLHLSGTTGNLVQGNYIGTDRTGTVAVHNAGDGVTLFGAPGNTIGGTNTGAGNLLSGNSQGGVGLKGAGSHNNLVQGNFIGTDASGGRALGNTFSGITIFGGNSNLVGGTTTAARNIVSANKLSGIYVTTNSVGNLVQGNFIGVDVTGSHALGNATNGISIDSASSNTVGGTTSGARNVISGNGNYGIEIFNATATANSVQGNYIGPDVTGQSALANQLCGVHILSPANTIGGSVAGAGNVISGNGQDGLFLDGAGAANNVVQGNLIGTAAGGTTGLMNIRAGVGISGAPGNTIGGTAPGAGNLISANTDPAYANGNAGIWLFTSGATGNLIQGNKIGTDITGNLPLGNTYDGIYLEGAPTNTIGGAAPGAGNLISANGMGGVFLTNSPWNVIQGNLIGTTRDGLSALGNLLHAVDCQAGSCNTTIGGASGAGNRLAFSRTYKGYGYAGVRIRDGSTNNAILGNAIFLNDGLGIDLGGFGINPNIPCDDGTGANMAQNYPVLTQAVSGNGTGVRGTLNSRPNATFLLQFFANPTCGSPPFPHNGQGQFYLGQTNVVTGNDCNASFVASLPGSVPVGYVITATATDSANNTSEFSACVPVSSVPTLKVSPAANHQVSLAWTNTATGFVLEQTDSLSPPIQWTTVTNNPVLTNGQFVITLSATVTRRFYLLIFQ